MNPRLSFPLLAVLSLAACASPDPDYFTMSARPGTVMLTGTPRVVALRRVGLAGYLDRDDVVDSNNGTRVRIANNQRWSEPLGDMTGRVLAEDLGQRMPRSTVFSEAGSIAAQPDTTVEIDIQRFDATPDNMITLVSQVAISHGDPAGRKQAAKVEPIRLQIQARPGTGNRVDAMSTLLGQMADRIAALLRPGPGA